MIYAGFFSVYLNCCKAIVTRLIVSDHCPHLKYALFFLIRDQGSWHMRSSITYPQASWKAPMMLVSVSVSAGFHTSTNIQQEQTVDEHVGLALDC